MTSPQRRSIGSLISAAALSAAIWSCNLDTTSPHDLPHFAPAWQLVSIDGQLLPDTLGLSLENSPPGTQHKIEAGGLEFVFPRGGRVLRWSFTTVRLSDAFRFLFTFDAMYFQLGADSIVFPDSRGVPAEFFGGKHGDTLTVVTRWSGDSTTPAVLVGGSHRWIFARDTSIHPQ
jgi:hypothetical protein